jgi:YHS domain-containing protein
MNRIDEEIAKYLASSTQEHDGRTYYFVDEEARREFETQPAAPQSPSSRTV